MIRIPRKYLGVARFYLIVLNILLFTLSGVALYYINRESNRLTAQSYKVALICLSHTPSFEKQYEAMQKEFSESIHTFECKLFDAHDDRRALKDMSEDILTPGRFDFICPFGMVATQIIKELSEKREVTQPIIFQNMLNTRWNEWVAEDKNIESKIIGITGGHDWKKRVSLIQRVKPRLSHITILSGPITPEWSEVYEGLAEELNNRSIESNHIIVENTQQIRERLRRDLGSHTDLIWINRDPIVMSGIESIVKIANEQHIPIYASDEESVKRGAAYALALRDGFQGEVAGKMIRALTDGGATITDLKTINLEDCGNVFFVNEEAVALQHPDVDPAILYFAKDGGVFLNKEPFFRDRS